MADTLCAALRVNDCAVVAGYSGSAGDRLRDGRLVWGTAAQVTPWRAGVLPGPGPASEGERT